MPELAAIGGFVVGMVALFCCFGGMSEISEGNHKAGWPIFLVSIAAVVLSVMSFVWGTREDTRRVDAKTVEFCQLVEGQIIDDSGHPQCVVSGQVVRP